MILRYVFTILAFAYLINCSGNSSEDTLTAQGEFRPPEIQFTQAMLMFDNQQYELAKDKFNNITKFIIKIKIINEQLNDDEFKIPEIKLN